jgi:hypothetical protein
MADQKLVYKQRLKEAEHDALQAANKIMEALEILDDGDYCMDAYKNSLLNIECRLRNASLSLSTISNTIKDGSMYAPE